MGKAQKLKEIRRQERLAQANNRQEKSKIFKIVAGVVIVVIAVLIGWRWLSPGQGPETASLSDAVNQTEETNMEKIAVLQTNLGLIKLKLHNDKAPATVANFEKLANEGFYDGIKFHRVIKDFMIQTGDPNSKDDDWSDDGMGGPGYIFDDEINDQLLVKGSVAMANSGPNTNGSQFFIVTAESTPWLDGLHTNFGEVIEGLEVVQQIEAVATNQNDHPLEDIVIEKVLVEEK